MLPVVLGILTVAALAGAVWFWDRRSHHRAEGSRTLGSGDLSAILGDPGHGGVSDLTPLAISWEPTGWGGVFVQCGDKRCVLIQLPVINPGLQQLMPTADELGRTVLAVVAVPHKRGHIWPLQAARRFGVTEEMVFLSHSTDGGQDPEPERTRGLKTLDAEGLQIGTLTVTADDGGVLVRHRDSGRLLLGPDVSLRRLTRAPIPHIVAGTVDMATSPDDYARFADTLATLRMAVLISSVVPGRTLASGDLLSVIGIRGMRLEIPESDPLMDYAVWWLLEVARSHSDLLDSTLDQMTDVTISDAIIEAIIHGENALARTLATRAAAERPDGAFAFQLGILDLMDRQPEAALGHFRSAVTAEDPYVKGGRLWPTRRCS